MQLVSGSHDGCLRLWDIAEGKCVKVLSGHGKTVRDIVLHPERPLILSASPDRILCWDLPLGNLSQIIPAKGIAVNSLAINHAGVVAAGGSKGMMQLWDLPSGTPFQRICRTKAYESEETPICVFSTAFDRIGTKLISSDTSNVISCYREAYVSARKQVDEFYVELKPTIKLGKAYKYKSTDLGLIYL
jgi:pleiotropic regulator 1